MDPFQIRDCLVLIGVCSLVPLGFGMVSGLLLAVFQTATQIQEQTLSFLIRLGVVGAVLVCGGPWAVSQTVEFAEDSLRSLEVIRFHGK